MGIQVQFLSRFCIVWNVPCFGPKYTLRSPNERKSLEVGVGDFYKHRGLQTILQHDSGASAWPAWCSCAGLTFSVLQTLELKAEFLQNSKTIKEKKISPGLGASLWSSFSQHGLFEFSVHWKSDTSSMWCLWALSYRASVSDNYGARMWGMGVVSSYYFPLASGPGFDYIKLTGWETRQG